MFQRFFGETLEDQVAYLQWRVIVTVISVILCFFGLTQVFALVMLFVWGWNAVKAMFGFATLGALFSGNVVFGAVIFVVYVVISYLVGMFVAALGLGRYVYLKVKGVQTGRED